MNTLQREVLKRATLATVVAYASIVSAFATIQVLNYVNVLMNSDAAAGKSLLIALLVLPELTVDLLPFAFLIGVIGVLTLMNLDSEVVAIRAAGGGWSIISLPVCALGAVFALAGLLIGLFLEPFTSRQVPVVVNAAVMDALRSAPRSSGLKMFGDGIVVWVGERLPEGSPGGVVVVDARDPATQLVYVAREASVIQSAGKELIVLADGFSQRKSATNGEVLSVGFRAYPIDLASFAPPPPSTNLRPRDRSTPSLLSFDPNDQLARERPDRLRTELHRRLSNWLYTFAFGAIAAYFCGGVQPDRNGRMRNAALAIGIALMVRSTGFITLNDAGASAAMAALVYTIPLLVSALFLGLDYRRHAAGIFTVEQGNAGARLLADLPPIRALHRFRRGRA